jgi:hypothetical protein
MFYPKKNNDQLMVTNQTTEQNGMVKLSRLHILSYYIQKAWNLKIKSRR